MGNNRHPYKNPQFKHQSQLIGVTQRIPLALPRSLSGWQSAGGTAFTWTPSPATLTYIENAPVQDVPPSFQQEQHLRSFQSHHQNGSEMERLLILTWDMPGQCDLAVMSDAINTHLRRHDTYHSWYSFEQDNRVSRRVIPEPSFIEFLASHHGEMSWDQVRQQILATPSPQQWDCFRFGVIQRTNSFSFYASIDHLHSDILLVPILFRELYKRYDTLMAKGAILELPKPASYFEFCTRQRQETAKLGIEDPSVHEWIKFLESNNGTLPKFPLTLGDTKTSSISKLGTINLMDAQETHCFQQTCKASVSTFFAGILACFAMVEAELIGTNVYHAITPTTTRTTPAEMKTCGWYTGVVPLTVQVANLDFTSIARKIHASFRIKRHLARVPIERIMELTARNPAIHLSDSGGAMVSYLDTRLPPIKHDLFEEFERLNGNLFTNSGASKNVALWVTRSHQGTTLSISHPDNPIAMQSVTEYSNLLQAICLRVSQSQSISTCFNEAM
jgi:hypothetical protein